MSKTLDTMQQNNWAYGGSAGYARYEFSDDFVDEGGQEYAGGNKSYLEVPTTISGSVVTVPAYPDFPETEAAIKNNGVTVTCHLLDSNRVKRTTLFEDCRIYTSLPSVVSLSQLVLANGASRIQRDTDVWTKEQVIDYVETRPPAAKMTSLVYGTGRLARPAALGSDPILLGDNDERIPANLVHSSKGASLNSAKTMLDALGGGTLVVDAATPVASDVTIPSTIALRFEGQGQLTGSSKAVTIVGPLSAPPQQIFASGVTVLLTGNTSLTEIESSWWGKNATGIQAAITAGINAAKGATIYLPDGGVSITSNISTSGVNGLIVKGHGGRTQLDWAGNATDPMFTGGDLANCLFADFTITASAATPLAEAFRIENSAVGGVAPMFNCFSNIWIDGTDGGVGIGFRGKVGAGGNANNDFMFFNSCHVLNYSHSGWTIEGSQSHGWKMLQCHAVAALGIGKCAVSGGGSVGTLGTFFWDGGFVGNNTEADFFVGNIASLSLPTEIANLSSEGSKRFLVNGPLGIVSRIKVRNVRWNGDAIHADGIVVDLHAAGPYDFDNCVFQGGVGDSVKIFWETSQTPIEPSFTFDNSTILGAETTLAGAFPGRAPTSRKGSSLADPSTGATTLWLDTLSINAGNKASGGFQVLNELTTIAAAATTDTAIQIPAKVVVMSVSVLVDTAIPTATTFTVTGTTSGTTFNTAAVPTSINNSDPGTAAGAYYNATAQTVRITPNLTPGAATGKVRVCVVYYQSTPPSA